METTVRKGRRPQPAIAEAAVRDGAAALEVVPAKDVWALLYRGRPASLRVRREDVVLFKYRRHAWPTRGYALAVARRCNRIFGTTDFSIGRMVLDASGA